MNSATLNVIESMTATSTREGAAAIYAEALNLGRESGIEWSWVNHYIVNRWSMSGLEYVKRLAWKQAPGLRAYKRNSGAFTVLELHDGTIVQHPAAGEDAT